MPRYSFNYTPYAIPPTDPFPNGQTIHRPMMVAHLIGPGGRQSSMVCLDTGADHCIFPLSFAALVGLDTLQMKMHMTGGCGSMANATYYADVEIQLPIVTNGATSVISFKTYAGFTAGMDAQGIGLLGQVGFFENYHTTFDHKGKLFHIETR